MTLRDAFEYLSQRPSLLIAYFVALPVLALIVGIVSGERAKESPAKFVFSALVYLACIPGVFAMTLAAYLFLFERGSIFDAQLVVQWLPILSMFATLFAIRRAVDLTDVPGFDRITGLVFFMMALFGVLWVLDHTRIWVVSLLPFWQGALLFIGVLLIGRYGFSRFMRRAE